jgi:hypothetical protein
MPEDQAEVWTTGGLDGFLVNRYKAWVTADG